MTDYIYPLDYETYNEDEIVVLVDFLAYLEDNYKHYDYETLKKKSILYKKTLNSIKEEKRINEEFLKLSGINIYKVLREFGL